MYKPKIYKPGQLITINKVVYRVKRNRNHYSLSCMICAEHHKSERACLLCVKYLPHHCHLQRISKIVCGKQDS